LTPTLPANNWGFEEGGYLTAHELQTRFVPWGAPVYNGKSLYGKSSEEDNSSEGPQQIEYPIHQVRAVC